MNNNDFARAQVKRPCLEVDFGGAGLNQRGLNILIDLLRNSMGDYDCVDIHLLRVSREAAIPKLVATYNEKVKAGGE